jgi:hypothetical protein
LTIEKDLSKQECRGVTMIEIHLYGNLRALVSGSNASEDTQLKVEYIPDETFAQLVIRLGLEPKDLGDCFINGNLAKYEQVMADNDRVGLFPFNMVLLCGGQHLKGHGYTKKDVDVDYY